MIKMDYLTKLTAKTNNHNSVFNNVKIVFTSPETPPHMRRGFRGGVEFYI